MIRAFTFVLLSCVSVFLIGCKEPEQSQAVWEQLKIGDIAPSRSGQQTVITPISTINIDVHIFEIPSNSIDKLDDIWEMLVTKPLRFHSYKAFTANSFVVRFGRVWMYKRIQDLLRTADGHKIVTVSLLLPNGQANDLTVRGLNAEQKVSYITANGRSEGGRQYHRIGPGIIALRIKAEKIPGVRDVCKLTAYPVFTIPVSGSIPELSARAKLHEVLFSSVTFGLQMAPGDFIMLGPEEYDSSQTALGSLFFSKPQSSLFPDTAQRTVPQPKPAVRVFLLVCNGMSN